MDIFVYFALQVNSSMLKTLNEIQNSDVYEGEPKSWFLSSAPAILVAMNVGKERAERSCKR